jgi:molybdopterin synthase sulfur carrier subunit
MRWKLFATLAETAGDTELAVDIEESDPTLEDALDSLLAAYPELESEVFDADGSLHDHVRLLCDGQDPFHEGDGLTEPVTDVEECALFPPVSGG